MDDFKKQIPPFVFSLLLLAVGASGKAIKDVEGLKAKIEYAFLYIKETRNDVRVIKKYLMEK